MDWTNTQVQFDPWCGNDYENGIAGQRVLILGESNYHSCDEDLECKDEANRSFRHRTLTHFTVEHWKDNSHSSPVSYRVPQLFGMSKAQFWQSVVFYNYLQTFVGPAAGQRPKENQWADQTSAKAFQ